MGMRETKEINIDGRIQLDMYIHMQKDHKLSSYSLNAVSFQFLGDTKEELHYSLLWGLQNKSADARKSMQIYWSFRKNGK
jgi:DNA polymerase delta subunit 1